MRGRSVLVAALALGIGPAAGLAQSATPAAGNADADAIAATLRSGEWKGTYAGYERADATQPIEVSFVFTDQSGRVLVGKQVITHADGTVYEEPTEAAVFSDGEVVMADTDGLKFGELVDGTLYLAKMETGPDDGAFLATLRLDEKAPVEAGSADVFRGRWVGSGTGVEVGQADVRRGQIKVADITGPAFAAEKQVAPPVGAWSTPELMEGVLMPSGRVHAIDLDGYHNGRLLDSGVLDLAYTESGSDTAAKHYVYSRQGDAKPAAQGTPDLAGTWTGGGVSFDGGTATTMDHELVLAAVGDSGFAGTLRAKGSDGAWGEPSAVQAVTIADGTVALADEDGYAFAKMDADGSLELAYLEPGVPEPTVVLMTLTRQP